jgi:hypothetical protein
VLREGEHDSIDAVDALARDRGDPIAWQHPGARARPARRDARDDHAPGAALLWTTDVSATPLP